MTLDEATTQVRGVPVFGLVEDLVALGRRTEAEATLGRMLAEERTRYVEPERSPSPCSPWAGGGRRWSGWSAGWKPTRHGRRMSLSFLNSDRFARIRATSACCAAWDFTEWRGKKPYVTRGVRAVAALDEPR